MITRQQLENENAALRTRVASLESQLGQPSDGGLRAGEKLFFTVFDNSPTAQLIVQLTNGQILDANQAFCHLTGYPRADLPGRTAGELNLWANPDDQNRIRARLQVEGCIQDLEVDFRIRSGEIRTVSISFEPVDLQGLPCLISTAIDITQRKQAEAALARDAAFRRAVIERAAEGLCVCHEIAAFPYLEFSLWNEQMTRITGYTQAEINRSGWYQTLYPDPEYQHKAVDRMRRMRQGQDLVADEWEITRSDGAKRTLSISTSVIQDGETVHVLGLMSDVTERRRAEEQLRRSEALLHEAHRIADLESWSVDLRTDSFEIGPLGDHILGLPGGVYPIATVLKRIFPADLPDVTQTWAAASSTGQPLDLEHRLLIGGEFRWVRVKGLWKFDAQGKPVTALGTTQDITERKFIEELAAAQRDLARIPSAVTSEQAAWPLCLAAVLRASGMDSGGVYLLNAGQTGFDLVYHQGLGPDFIQAVSFYPLDAPGARVVLAGKAVYLTSAETQQRQYYRTENMQSVAIIPIHHQGQAIGCINLASHSLPRVPEYSRKLLEMSAAEIGNLAVYLRTQGALRRSEALLKEAQRIGQTGYWEWSGPGQDILCSDEFFNILDIAHTGNLIAPDIFFERVAVEDRERLIQLDRQALANRSDMDYEFSIDLPAGEKRYFHQHVRVTYDGDGQAQRMMAIVQDITARKQAEAATQAAIARYYSLFEQSHDAVFILGLDGRHLEVNRRAADLLGYSPAELLSLSVRDISAELDESVEVFQNLVNGQTYPPYERRFCKKTGEIVPVEINAELIRSADGRPLYVQSVVRDITDRKHTDEALRASEERYRMLAENMSDIIWLSDMSLRTVYISPSLTRLRGFTLEDMNTLPPERLIAPQSLALAMATLAERLAPGNQMPTDASSPVLLDLEFTRKDGSTFWCESRFTLIRDASGAPTHILGTGRDITERLRAEQALRESEARFSTVFQASHEAISIQRLSDGVYLDVNQAFCQLFDLPRQQIVGSTGAGHQPWKDAAPYAQLLQQVLEHGHCPGLEAELNLPGGKAGYFLLSGRQIQIGAEACIMLSVRDITTLKQAQMALRDSDERFNRAFRSSPIGILVFELQGGRCREVNDAFLEMMGLPREEVVGRSALELNVFPYLDAVPDFYPRFLADGEVRGIELFIRTRSGKVRYALTSARTLEMQGESLGMLLAVDITDRKQAEAMLLTANDILEKRVQERTLELNQLNQALEKALHSRDQFLAMMSHELRTPLAQILTATELLQLGAGSELSARQQRFIQIIGDSGQRLLTIINDVLEFTSLQSGAAHLQIGQHSLGEICPACLQSVEPRALQKQQQLSFSLSPETIRLTVDEAYLCKILLLLLDNAIKFTPAGGRITLTACGLVEQKLVQISVADTGIGIKAEDLPRLFQPFVQLDARLSREYEGTGLGLALAKALAELHGGSIAVTSVFGQGSTFTLTLPWKDA